MLIFQGNVFIWSRAYSEIFKSALVCFHTITKLLLFRLKYVIAGGVYLIIET